MLISRAHSDTFLMLVLPQKIVQNSDLRNNLKDGSKSTHLRICHINDRKPTVLLGEYNTCVNLVSAILHTCLTSYFGFFHTATHYYSKFLHHANLHFVDVRLPMRSRESRH